MGLEQKQTQAADTAADTNSKHKQLLHACRCLMPANKMDNSDANRQ